MPDPSTLPFHYDPNRPAAEGRWVVLVKTPNMVKLSTYHTERECREAAGLSGGSDDPRYRPS